MDEPSTATLPLAPLAASPPEPVSAPASAPPQEARVRARMEAPDAVAQRVSRIETDLRKLEKSSGLAVQMGLISSVHAETNDQGIAGVRAELEKLATDRTRADVKVTIYPANNPGEDLNVGGGTLLEIEGARIKGYVLEDGVEIFAYFRHEDERSAPVFAHQLRQLALGEADPMPLHFGR